MSPSNQIDLSKSGASSRLPIESLVRSSTQQLFLSLSVEIQNAQKKPPSPNHQPWSHLLDPRVTFPNETPTSFHHALSEDNSTTPYPQVGSKPWTRKGTHTT